MNGKAAFLTATALLFALTITGSYGQEDQPTGAETSQPSGLSLEDLDALMEQGDEEDLSTIIGPQIVDLVLLGVFFSLVLLSFAKKNQALKYVTLIFSVVYLGFVKSSLVSVVNIFGVINWSFPPFRYSLFWYVFMLFTVLSTLIWGRIYCGRICAFGALTQLLDKLLGSSLRFELPSSIERRAIYLKYLLLGGVIVYFLITSNNFVYRYTEPFWMFTLNGSMVMWILLGLLLLVTVFIRNFYCRYLCPVGAALGLISKLALFKIKRWSECKTCKICERTCKWNAIRGNRIQTTECVRCDDCERLYRNEDRCPHGIVLKKTSIKRRTPAPVQISS
jgi:polyferredoxin